MMELDKMAETLNAVLTNTYSNEELPEVLDKLRDSVYNAARVESGVRTEELTDENMEDSAIVRLFWSTNANIWSKILITAANKQAYYKEIKG